MPLLLLTCYYSILYDDDLYLYLLWILSRTTLRSAGGAGLRVVEEGPSRTRSPERSDAIGTGSPAAESAKVSRPKHGSSSLFGGADGDGGSDGGGGGAGQLFCDRS